MLQVYHEIFFFFFNENFSFPSGNHLRTREGEKTDGKIDEQRIYLWQNKYDE